MHGSRATLIIIARSGDYYTGNAIDSFKLSNNSHGKHFLEVTKKPRLQFLSFLLNHSNAPLSFRTITLHHSVLVAIVSF